MKTAVHKFDSNAKNAFIMPDSATTPLLSGNFLNKLKLNVDQSAQLPLDSAIPKMNPKKLNQEIQNTKKKETLKVPPLQSPLTAFNIREKQYKRSLSGTYGPDYKEKAEAEKKNLYERDERELGEEGERAAEDRDMYECLRDLNMSNQGEIPDNYLY